MNLGNVDPRLRFVLTMTLFGVALWMIFREEIMGPILTPLRALTAEGTLRLIHLTGLDAVRHANFVFHSSGFGIEITRGCTGFAGAAVLTAGIWAYPSATNHSRVFGTLLGVAVFAFINLVRMTHLYHLGVANSPWFHLAHETFWQVGMMLTTFCLWLIWVLLGERGEKSTALVPSGTRHLDSKTGIEKLPVRS